MLCGSTNFSFNGMYLQANNTLVFEGADVAGLFEQYFEAAFKLPKSFAKDPLAAKWHLIQTSGVPPVQICLSPHSDTALSLGPVAFLSALARSGSGDKAMDIEVSGVEPGRRRLNGAQTTGWEYRNLSQPVLAGSVSLPGIR
jgi:hypothetical protein